MTCADVRLGLGAYVLGALDPADRAAVESHLDTCPACRDELSELAGLPGLLAHLTIADVETGPPQPSAALLDRLLDQVAADRRRASRRGRWLAAAAAAVVVAGGGTAAGLTLGHSGGAAADVRALSAADPRTHVSASVWLRPKAWGTEVTLSLAGVPADEHCRLVAVASDGHRESAGSWEATYAGKAEVTGAVSVPVGQLDRLDVVTFAGQRLVSVPVPASARGAVGGGADSGTGAGADPAAPGPPAAGSVPAAGNAAGAPGAAGW